MNKDALLMWREQLLGDEINDPEELFDVDTIVELIDFYLENAE